MTCYELVANTEFSNQFTVLKKYQGKLDCLVYKLVLDQLPFNPKYNRDYRAFTDGNSNT